MLNRLFISVILKVVYLKNGYTTRTKKKFQVREISNDFTVNTIPLLRIGKYEM